MTTSLGGRSAGTGEHHERASTLLVTVDANQVIQSAEGSALEMLALVPADIRARSIDDALGGHAVLRDALRRALDGEAASGAVAFDGTQVQVFCVPRTDDEGRIVGAVLVGASAVAERPVGVPDDLARYVLMVFGQVPGVIWCTDDHLRVTHVVGRLKQICIGEGPLRGQTIAELLRRDDPTDPMVAAHRAALAGEQRTIRYGFAGRCYQFHVESLRDGSGEVVGAIGVAIDVTELEQAKEDLARSEARLAEAQRLAHVGSWDWNLTTDTVEWSDELYRIYGLEKEAFTPSYEGFLARLHPDDRGSTKAAIDDARKNPKPVTLEHRIVCANGTVRMLHSRGAVIVGEGGQPVRMAGSCWDITEQWLAKASLERSVSLLNATLESTADGLLVVDREGRFTTYNETFVKLWRLPNEIVESRDDAAALRYVLDQLEDPEAFLRKVQELYQQPEAVSFDVLPFKDGRVVERYSQPQRLGDEIVGRVWSFRDVTERVRLLRRAELLADASRLLASLDIGRALDALAHMLVPEFAACCLIDAIDGEAGPRRMITVAAEDCSHFVRRLPNAVLGGHPVLDNSGERTIMSVPVSARTGLLAVLTIVARKGRRYGEKDLHVIEDVAGRMALAMENAQLYRDTQDALRARDEFLSIAAHEIRGPVAALHLAVQSLGRGLPAEAAERAYAVIEREDRRIAKLVDELLDVARIRGGRLLLTFEEVDLAVVVRDVVAEFSNDLARSGSQLTVTTEGRCVGYWDRSRIEQVVTNLLSNAIKFGKGKPINVDVKGEPGRTRLVVRDRGIGVAPEMQERIFSPFERAVPARRYGGLGLGLYIVRTIVDAMGGSVHLDSEPGVGSTFTVELPERPQ